MTSWPENPNNSPETNARLAEIRMRFESGKKFKPPTEAQDQAKLAAWLDARGILYSATANGGVRHIRTATSLKAQGVKKGLPDIFVYDPPPNRPGKVGFALELKRAVGGALSPEQHRWLVDLAERGWVAKVCEGYSDAVAELEGAGYGR